MSSRLFVEIREKLGLAYSISCDITNYEEVGYFNIYTQNEPKDTIKMLEHIFKELVKFKKRNRIKLNLKIIKKTIVIFIKLILMILKMKMNIISHQLLFNKPLRIIDMRIKEIDNIQKNNYN